MRDTRLETARATFTSTESNLARLQQRLTDTSAKLLAAGMSVAAIDRKIEAFATDTHGDASAAAHLVGERETARNVALLLEQAEAFLESEVAKAKGAVIEAERAAREAQRAILQQQIGAAADELVRSNARPVQRLLKLMNTLTELDAIEAGGGIGGRHHPEYLFGAPLQAAVKAVWPETEDARAGFLPADGEVAMLDTQSTKVTEDERRRYRTGGLSALLPDDVEPAVTDDFDFASASRRLLNARNQLDHFRSQVTQFEHKQKLKAGDPNIESYLERYREEVKNWERNVASMEADMARRRA